LDWATEYLHRDANYLKNQADFTYTSYEVFNKGKAAFILGEINWIGYGFYNDMEDDYALVPFPTESGKVHAVGRLGYNVAHFGIPANAKNPKDLALFFDAFTEPLPGTAEDSWEDYMLENTWRGNTESMKWYKTMLNNAEDTYYSDIGSDRAAIFLTILNEIYDKRTVTAAEGMESIAAEATANIDEYINKDKKFNGPKK